MYVCLCVCVYVCIVTAAPVRYHLISHRTVLLAIAAVLYPIWPESIRGYVPYLLGFLLALLVAIYIGTLGLCVSHVQR